LARVEGKGPWLRRGLAFVAILLVAGSLIAWRVKSRPAAKPKYLLQPITSGDVIETVQSTERCSR
ncbi:MAG TPA: efflux RND transporter periplasmic adaptor subunit, partial [Polyangiaceae bacterium]|nr:efflux RND transporter periplasmic adaptor subunit [Polyangiaceae bacterium]